MKDQFKILIRFIKICGNSAHIVRNIISIRKKDEYPELISIDNGLATIEGKCRQIIILLDNNDQNTLITVKQIMKEIMRSLKFQRTILQEFNNGYDYIEAELKQKMIDNILFQIDIIQQVDEVLNNCYSSLLNDNLVVKQELKVCQLIQQQCDFDNLTFKNNVEIDKESIIKYTMDLSNVAHNLTNIVCTLQKDEKLKIQANLINDLANKLENQFRANKVQIDKVLLNVNKLTKEYVQTISNNTDQIKIQFESEMSQIKNCCQLITDSQPLYSKFIQSQA